jgi:hypothetical protein
MSVLVHVAIVHGGVQNSMNQSVICTKWAYTALVRATLKQWQCLIQTCLRDLRSIFLSRLYSSPTQRPLPDHKQHSQDTDIHAHGRIRTRNPSKKAAGEPTPETVRPLGSAFTFHTVVIIKNIDLRSVTPCSLV